MRADDEAAFEAFVAARSGDLMRTAVLLTRDHGHAEDGVTFPSGATAHLSTHWGDPGGMTSMTVMSDPVPAGTALLDQVLANATTNALTVSGPSEGVLAEVHLADGSPFTTMPLVCGVGIGPLLPRDRRGLRRSHGSASSTPAEPSRQRRRCSRDDRAGVGHGDASVGG